MCKQSTDADASPRTTIKTTKWAQMLTRKCQNPEAQRIKGRVGSRVFTVVGRRSELRKFCKQKTAGMHFASVGLDPAQAVEEMRV